MDKDKIEEMMEWRRNLKVSQLIKILKTYDQDAHIMIDNIYTSTGQYLQQSMMDSSHGNLIFVRVTV